MGTAAENRFYLERDLVFVRLRRSGGCRTRWRCGCASGSVLFGRFRPYWRGYYHGASGYAPRPYAYSRPYYAGRFSFGYYRPFVYYRPAFAFSGR